MGPLQRVIRRTCQTLLCAGALVGGALLAHYAHARSAAAPVAVETVLPRERSAPAPRVERALEPSPVSAGPPPAEPMRPFARALRDGMVISGRTPHRLILFTFDDGPDPRNTPRLLDELDEVGVKAVFFLTASRIMGRGPWEQQNQALAREILRRGHIVGNHTMDHAQLPLLDDAGVLAQVEGAEAVFERVLGERTWLFRPPGGARSARVDRLLSERGYTQVLWNVGTGDFQVRSADDVFRTFLRVLERRERESGDRGGVVLLHDTHEWSVEAFPRMISWLREQNCELLERGEELYDVVDDPALFYAPRAGATPSAEAPLSTANRAVIAERQRLLRDETSRRCARLAQR